MEITSFCFFLLIIQKNLKSIYLSSEQSNIIFFVEKERDIRFTPLETVIFHKKGNLLLIFIRKRHSNVLVTTLKALYLKYKALVWLSPYYFSVSVYFNLVKFHYEFYTLKKYFVYNIFVNICIKDFLIKILAQKPIKNNICKILNEFCKLPLQKYRLE